MGLVDQERDPLILEMSLLGGSDAKDSGPGSGRTGLPVARETESVVILVEMPSSTARLRRIAEVSLPKALTGCDGDIRGERGASA